MRAKKTLLNSRTTLIVFATIWAAYSCYDSFTVGGGPSRLKFIPMLTFPFIFLLTPLFPVVAELFGSSRIAYFAMYITGGLLAGFAYGLVFRLFANIWFSPTCPDPSTRKRRAIQIAVLNVFRWVLPPSIVLGSLFVGFLLAAVSGFGPSDWSNYQYYSDTTHEPMSYDEWYKEQSGYDDKSVVIALIVCSVVGLMCSAVVFFLLTATINRARQQQIRPPPNLPQTQE